MILAAGLSPAWQQIVLLDALRVGEVNRACEVHWCASGKVLNVGIALAHLCRGEISAKTVSLVGGPPQSSIAREFADAGVAARWVTSLIPTRICTTILDRATGMTTELVENAQPIPQSELAEFSRVYAEYAAAADVVVLTGSLPVGTPHGFYAELLAKTRGRVILDARGDSLLAALERRPFVVKPNREELGQTLGSSLETDAELLSAMRELNRRGAAWVVISQGNGAVWISSADSVYRAQSLQVDVVNPIGCGDCLAAGIAWAIAARHDMPDAVRYGIAAAAENARQLLPARLDRMRVEQLAASMTIESIA